MIKKIQKSLAYRLPVFYKRWLHFKKIRKTVAKDSLDATVITMTGKRIINMTRLSVLSIANTWDKLPKLIIITDGTIATAEVESSLNFWPGELIINDWQLTEQYHSQKKRNNLVRYAKNNVLGKKMAVIFHYAEQQPIVWLDSDILFFNDFTKYIPQYKGEAIVCGGSEDFFPVYDDRILKFYDNNIYDLYKFNSGIVFIYGVDIYEQLNMEALLDELTSYDYFFTEQTVFAHLASKSLGIIWTTDIIKNFINDNQQLAPMPVKDVVGRHYTTNVRHLFWRDAFFNFNN